MKIKIKISKFQQYLSMLALTILFIRPQYFISAFQNSVFIFCFIQTGAVLLMLFFSKGKIKLNKFLICIILYYIYDFINTGIQNSGQLNGVVIAGVWTFSTVYLVSFYVSEIGVLETLKQLSICLTLLLWIALFLMFFFPEGLLAVVRGTGRPTIIHFLGESNRITIYHMLSIILVVCNVVINCEVGKRFVILSLSVMPLTYVMLNERSSTALMAGVILILGYAFYRFFPKMVQRLISNPFTSICIILICFIGITKILSLKVVSDFVVNVLNKDVTLSERTTIWALTYSVLTDLRVLLFGFGEASAGGYITIWTGHTFSAHNIFLQICLLGGVILLALFIVMIIITVKNISKIPNRRIKASLSICMLAFFFINMLEVYPFSVAVLSLYVLNLTGEILSDPSYTVDKGVTYKTSIS